MATTEDKSGYKLNQESREFLAKLRGSDFFTGVGTLKSDSFDTVTSWDDALRIYHSVEVANVSIEARNLIALSIPAEMYAQWNNITNSSSEIDEIVEKQVNDSVARRLAPVSMLEAWRGNMLWDLGHTIQEIEYSRYLEGTYFRDKSKLYMDGYFPCGWRGHFPDGKFIVF